jgi:hypothetical protein
LIRDGLLDCSPLLRLPWSRPGWSSSRTSPASVGVVTKDGFSWRSEAAFLRDFAGDVEPSKASALYAVQGLTGCKHKDLDCGMGSEAYVVPRIDRGSHRQSGARAISGQAHSTVELDSGHISLVSHPQEIADPILLAAGQKKSQ